MILRAQAVDRTVIAIAWGLALALVARKTLFLRQRDISDYAVIDTYAIVEIVLVGLTCLLLVTRPNLGLLWRQLHGTSVMWLLMFCGVGILSAAWLESPAYSLFQAVEVTSQVFLVLFALGQCRSFDETEQRVVQISLITIFLGMLVTLKFHGWQAVTFSFGLWHTNSYSTSSVMLVCYCVGEYFNATPQRAQRLIRYGVAGFGALVLGTSAASYIAFFVGISVAALLLRGTRWPIVSVLGICIGGGVLFPDRATAILFPAKTKHAIETLHGRVRLWEEYSALINDRPFIGYGYAMATKVGEFKTTNAHNSVFSVLVGTGAVGMLVTLAAGLILLREIRINCGAARTGSVGCGAAILAGLANSLSLSFLGEAWKAPTLVFVCFLAQHFLIHTRSPDHLIRERSFDSDLGSAVVSA